MSIEEYAPDRKVLGVLIVVGLILAAGMLLVLQPSALAALSGQGGPKSTEVNVKIPDGVSSSPTLSFQPRNLSVKVSLNNTIVWTDSDTGGQAHTATTTSGPSKFDSGPLNEGDQFSVTLTVAGTYKYHCIFHSWMIGTISVNP
ncbi:hypothetical protein E6H23_05355 [Candidatus Bathyarchaeota archaeon]|nr:MAG: hypothetical protein E6H23_05355 [Candidatus Bathyarchaeota archaeon]